MIKILLISLIGWLILIIGLSSASKAGDFSKIIKKHTTKVHLVNKIIHKESRGKYKAKNKHCIGLMQINTKVWLSKKSDRFNLVKLGIIRRKSDLYIPEYNIKAGIYILKHYKYNYKRYRGIMP